MNDGIPHLSIQNLSKEEVNLREIKRVFQEVLGEIQKLKAEKESDFEKIKRINLIFVPREENRRLNKEYRKLNKECDALTFLYKDDNGDVEEADLLVNIGFIREKFKDNISQKLRRSFIHSALHCFGFTHSKEDDATLMFGYEDKISENMAER